VILGRFFARIVIMLDGDLAGKVFYRLGWIGLVIRLVVVLSLFVAGIPS
jgi:hypothetical protein